MKLIGICEACGSKYEASTPADEGVTNPTCWSCGGKISVSKPRRSGAKPKSPKAQVKRVM
jgi:rRNA maturation protein Nop10